MNVEIGESQNAEITMNDTKVRQLTSTSSNAELILPTDFHGQTFTQPSLSSWPTVVGSTKHPHPWGVRSLTNATSATVGLHISFKHDKANDRLTFRYRTFDSQTSVPFTEAHITYTPTDGLDNATFEVKGVYSTSTSGAAGTAENPDSLTPASGSFVTVSDSTFSPAYQWEVSVTSGSGSRAIQGDAQFFIRADFSGTDIPDSTGISSDNKLINITATRGTFGGGLP